MTTSKGKKVAVSAAFSTDRSRITEEDKKRLGRKVDEKFPQDKLHLLDYEYERIQFTSMSMAYNHISAIDQLGEVWILAGYVSQNYDN